MKFNTLSHLFVITLLKIIMIVNAYAFADQKNIYKSQNEKLINQAVSYDTTHDSSIRYLAYRDVPALISIFSHGNTTLDFGCGTGISTEFLLKQNLNVTGIDISTAMLDKARQRLPKNNFFLIKDGVWPGVENKYDIVFSGFVLFEIGNTKNMVKYLKNAKKSMKKKGVFIAITGSQYMKNVDYYTYGTNYKQNNNLKSGGLVKSYLYDSKIEFEDYFWTENDYIKFFKQAGLKIKLIHYPLGKDNEPLPWRDEKITSPFVIIVAYHEER